MVKANGKYALSTHGVGLQYRVVILIRADHLPRQFDDTLEAEERSLIYVGTTCLEDFLAISASSSSRFIKKISSSRFFGKAISICEKLIRHFCVERQQRIKNITNINP
jgi:hypothetical protein